MSMEQYIETVIRPKIQGDGGEVRFAERRGDELTLVFQEIGRASCRERV